MTRILILIPNLGLGGAQKFFRQQLQALSNYAEVRGVVFNWDGESIENRSGNVISMEIPAGKNVIDKGWQFLRRCLKLSKLKKDFKADLTISHLEGADYVNILSGGKTICWIHGSKRFDGNITGFLGLIRHKVMMPLLYRRTTTIVTVSKGIALEMRHYIRQKSVPVIPIYNGFDIDQVAKLGSEEVSGDFRLLDGCKLVIVHCRLSLQKNLTTLLIILQRVLQLTPCKLIIVGDGELKEQLVDFSMQCQFRTWTAWSDLPFTDQFDVYFMGHQPNPLKFLTRCHLYVMTSLWEGFPLALCEALILKLPVLAADCPTGPREILTPHLSIEQKVEFPVVSPLGTLMPLPELKSPDSIQMWAAAIASVLENPARDTDDSAYQGLISKLSWKHNIDASIGVIENVLGAHAV